MTKNKWIEVIKESCKNANTYRNSFDGSIIALAEILEIRDTCQKMYKQSGSPPLIDKVNVNGGINRVRNPLLDTIIALNAQALSYWTSLGLTPSGLKKINEKELHRKRVKTLSEQVAEMLDEEANPE